MRTVDYLYFFLMIRRPPRSTLFPYTTALPIYIVPGQPDGDLAGLDGGQSGRAAHELPVRSQRQNVITEVRRVRSAPLGARRSEEHASELQSRQYLVCRLLLETKQLPTALYLPS